MKKILIISVILTLTLMVAVNAQQKNALIAFKKSVSDIGTVKEEGGLVSSNYDFVNSGEMPLIIQKVIASCDCTTVEFPKEPIAPGKSGSIKVVFDPLNRPGSIDKFITVYSNALTTTTVLQLKGFVKERPKTIEEIYSRIMGDFRFKTNHLSFDRVYFDKVKIDTLEFISVAKDPVKIGCKIEGYPHLAVRFVPEKLKTNEKGLMIVSYDAKKRNDWGFTIDRFYLTQDGKEINGGLITISASIEENFSALTQEQRNNAPKIEFVLVNYDFGTIEEGQSAEHEFEFSNTGKSDLIIRKIKPSCGCTTVEPADKVIGPGKKSSFKASFNTKGFSGRNAKSITVISNDPVNPTIILRMSGVVNSAKKQ